MAIESNDKEDKKLQEDDLLDEQEKAPDEEAKKKPFRKYVKVLFYSAGFLVLVLVSILTSILVYDLKSANQPVSFEQNVYSPEQAPLDVYLVPEFKLTLDKQEEESMSTIVQVELALAYKKDDQQVLTEIIERKDQIRDKVQYVIARKTYEEISTSTAREEILKKDLLNTLNSIMYGRVIDVYFNMFIVSRIPA